MHPDWVRMFFWYKDWYPGADTGMPGYTFDSPNMLSHYRTLDIYQEIGAAATVVGVEWAFKQGPPDWHNFARAIGDLMASGRHEGLHLHQVLLGVGLSAMCTSWPSMRNSPLTPSTWNAQTPALNVSWMR